MRRQAEADFIYNFFAAGGLVNFKNVQFSINYTMVSGLGAISVQ